MNLASRLRVFCVLAFAIAFRSIAAPTVDDVNWDGRFVPAPGVNGAVHSSAVIGKDLYLAGSFSKAGSNDIPYLVRWDGANWHALGGGVNGPVYALAVRGNELFVGGQFTQAGNVAATNIARWNGSDWQGLGPGLNGMSRRSFGNGSAGILCLVAAENYLYAGGGFEFAGDTPVANIARWDGTNWSALEGGVSAEIDFQTGDPTLVWSLGLKDNNLYAGGTFVKAGGIFATNIARWDGSHWNPLGAGIRGGTPLYFGTNGEERGGQVTRLTFHANQLYALGLFTQAGSILATNLAVWNGSNWIASPLKADAQIVNLQNLADRLYLSGVFNRINGKPAHHIALWNGRPGKPFGSGLSGYAWTMSLQSNSLFAAGNFGIAGGKSAGNVARWNGKKWTALGTGQGNELAADYVTAVAANPRGAFLFGNIRSAGLLQVNNATRWDGKKWRTLSTGLPAGSSIESAAAVGNDIFVSGHFRIPRIGATNLAKWNGTRWSSVGRFPGGDIRKLKSSGNKLYITGDFQLPKTGATNLAVWDGKRWSAIPAPADFVGLYSYEALAISGQDVYTYASYTDLQGAWRDTFRKWDGTNWTTLEGSLYVNETWGISDLFFYKNQLHLAGHFRQIGNFGVTNLAKWDGTQWSQVGSGSDLDAVNIQGISVTASNLYLCGDFDHLGNVAASHVARWNGSEWRPLGSGITDSAGAVYVTSMAAFSNKVYLCGSFTDAGAKRSRSFAIWTEPQD